MSLLIFRRKRNVPLQRRRRRLHLAPRPTARERNEIAERHRIARAATRMKRTVWAGCPAPNPTSRRPTTCQRSDARRRKRCTASSPEAAASFPKKTSLQSSDRRFTIWANVYAHHSPIFAQLICFILWIAGYKNQQWNRIVHIYLTQCWRGPSGVDDLTEEIEGKLGQLKLQEEQRIHQSLKPDEASNTVCEMMQLTIDIAMLYLGKLIPREIIIK